MVRMHDYVDYLIVPSAGRRSVVGARPVADWTLAPRLISTVSLLKEKDKGSSLTPWKLSTVVM